MVLDKALDFQKYNSDNQIKFMVFFMSLIRFWIKFYMLSYFLFLHIHICILYFETLKIPIITKTQ